MNQFQPEPVPKFATNWVAQSGANLEQDLGLRSQEEEEQARSNRRVKVYTL